MRSSIYVGMLRHRRFTPVRHEFTYPLFMVFLDIDDLPSLMKISRFTGYNRWNWASYFERDHFGDSDQSLRARLREDAQQRGLKLPDGKIFVLTHLRYLGYNFNPVSFYYCYDETQKLQMIMAEVNNTFGETENYWMTWDHQVHASESRKSRFAKTFYVSPFMDLAQEYEWTFTSPSERLVSQCVVHSRGEAIFDATLTMQRREWSAPSLLRTLAQFPWITMKVIVGIHWQALRLALKKVPVVPHPGKGHFKESGIRHWGASW